MLEFLKVHPIAEKPTASDSLKYHLHKALSASQPGRSYKNLHASDFTDNGFCPRERLLMQLLSKEPPNEHLTASTHMTFGLGHAVADLVIMAAVEAGVAVGDWKCLACGQYANMTYRPVKCVKCGRNTMSYMERRFRSQTSGISGGIDLFVNLHESKVRIVEIKSIKNDEFKTLVAPKGEHRVRTNLYMRLVEDSDDPFRDEINCQEALIVYVDKNGFGAKCNQAAHWKFGDAGFSPFKEFKVERNDADTDLYMQLASEYTNARLTKTICSGVCVTQNDGRAQKCPVRHQCFSNMFPVGENWG